MFPLSLCLNRSFSLPLPFGFGKKGGIFINHHFCWLMFNIFYDWLFVSTWNEWRMVDFYASGAHNEQIIFRLFSIYCLLLFVIHGFWWTKCIFLRFRVGSSGYHFNLIASIWLWFLFSFFFSSFFSFKFNACVVILAVSEFKTDGKRKMLFLIRFFFWFFARFPAMACVEFCHL